MKFNKKIILPVAITIIVIALIVGVVFKVISIEKEKKNNANNEISEKEKTEIMGVLYNDAIKIIEKYYPENEDLPKDDEGKYRYSFSSFSMLGENLNQYNTDKVKCNLEESFVTIELDDNGQRTYYTDLICEFR